MNITTSAIAAAGLAAASIGLSAPAALAAQDGACIPAGTTAFKKSPDGQASVYRDSGGIISACLSKKSTPLALAGWKRFIEDGSYELTAASGSCVAITASSTQTSSFESKVWVFDIKARTRWSYQPTSSGNQYAATSISDFTFNSGCSAAWVVTESGQAAPVNGARTVARNDSRGTSVVASSLQDAVADLQGSPQAVAYGAGPKLRKAPTVRRSTSGKRLVATFAYSGDVAAVRAQIGGRRATVTGGKSAHAPRGSAKRGSQVTLKLSACNDNGCSSKTYKIRVR